jgi:hypothetical protein
MNGTSESIFSPNASLSRGMAVTVLYRMQKAVPLIEYANSFADVKNSAYYGNAVKGAAAIGMVAGISESSFAPNMDVTKEQLVTLLYRYSVFKEIDVSVGEDTNILSYDDAFDISEWAIPAFQWACGAGVITGKTESTLDPKGQASRAEFAAMLYRFIT